KPVSSVRRLLLNALIGKTIKSFEAFAPEILVTENLAEQAKIQLKSTDQRIAPSNAFEDRGLVMTVAMPLRNSSGKIVVALLDGRLLNKALSIVTDIRNLLGDSATIFLGDVRIATNAKGQNVIGTLLNPERDRVLSRGEMSPFRDDRQFGLY